MIEVVLRGKDTDQIQSEIKNGLIDEIGNLAQFIVTLAGNTKVEYLITLGDTIAAGYGVVSMDVIPGDKNSLIGIFTMYNHTNGKLVKDTMISSIIHTDEKVIFCHEMDALVEGVSHILANYITSSGPISMMACNPVKISYDDPARRKYNIEYIRDRSINRKIAKWLESIRAAFNTNRDIIAEFQYTLQNSEGDYLVYLHYKVTFETIRNRRLIIGELNNNGIKHYHDIIINGYSNYYHFGSDVTDNVIEPVTKLIKKIKCSGDTLTREFYIKEREGLNV